MHSFKSAIYFLFEAEKVLSKNVADENWHASEETKMKAEKYCAMIHEFLNILLEDEMRIMKKLDNLELPDGNSHGMTPFSELMKMAKAIFEMTIDQKQTEEIFNQIGLSIISMRIKYASLKSTNPDLFA